jgi:hypothetical protein
VVGIALQVLPVDVLVDALLFDNEDLAAQAQNGVQLLLAQVSVMLADPIDCHGVISRKCLFWIVSAASSGV